MISANGGLPAHRYTPQVTQRWPRGSEPASLGNLNKVYQAHFAWPTLQCVCERTSMHEFTVNLWQSLSFSPNLTHNHELHQVVGPPGLTYLTHRWRVKQGEGKARHKRVSK